MSTRYDRNNCRIQCVVCNVVEKELGKMKMVLKLIDQGKKSLIDGLLERANKKPLREKVIVDTSSFYKRKTEELLKKHNIKSWWNK